MWCTGDMSAETSVIVALLFVYVGIGIVRHEFVSTRTLHVIYLNQVISWLQAPLMSNVPCSSLLRLHFSPDVLFFTFHHRLSPCASNVWNVDGAVHLLGSTDVTRPQIVRTVCSLFIIWTLSL